jgi:hypothetical protein
LIKSERQDRGNSTRACVDKRYNDIKQTIQINGFEGVINGIEGRSKESIELRFGYPEMGQHDYAEGVKSLTYSDAWTGCTQQP